MTDTCLLLSTFSTPLNAIKFADVFEIKSLVHTVEKTSGILQCS